MGMRATALRVPVGPAERTRPRRPGETGPTARVLALQRTAGNRAVVRLLQRQPKTPDLAPPIDIWHPKIQLDPSCTRTAEVHVTKTESVGDDKDKLKATLSDGSVYLVERKREVVPYTDSEWQPPKLSTGSDDDRVYAQLDWCTGSRGQIRIGANPQGALKELGQTITDTINNGGGAKEVVDAIRKQEITPFVSVDWAQSGQWHVTGEVGVSVNSTGYQGTSISGEVQKGRIGGKGGITLDERGRPTGGTISIVIHEAPPESFKCKTREKVYLKQRTTYRWTPWIPEHTETGTRPGKKPVPNQFFVFFKYAEPVILKKRSQAERDRLERELALGAHIVDVTAFTSPEGKHKKVPGFMGNVELAKRRGTATYQWAREAVEHAGAGSIDVAAPHEVDEPELHTLPDDKEGRELEAKAVKDFREDPEEAPNRTPEVMKQLDEAKSVHEQAQIAYPWMRRGVIKTTREIDIEVPYSKTTPGHWREAPDVCNPVKDDEIADKFPKVIL